MNLILPFLRISLAVLAYILIALLAAAAVRWLGSDIKEMQARSSPKVLIVGAVANLCVLASTLLLLDFLDQRPIGSLGLAFFNRDALFATVGAILIFALAAGFVGLLGHRDGFRVDWHVPMDGPSDMLGFLGAVMTLLIVAVQEEVLYRGYVTLNLLAFGPVFVVVASTVIFALIHLLTNRAGPYQITSWLIGGAIFSIIYLVSGSLWIPIVLHFATDLSNMLIFNIVGRFSFFTISPAFTPRQIVVVRVAAAILLVASAVLLYGPALRLA